MPLNQNHDAQICVFSLLDDVHACNTISELK